MRTRVDIVWGTGAARTAVSAYDAALNKAGISNFNLIALSSIIPPGALIAERGTFSGEGTGQVLPVVMARAAGRNRQVAGLGWVHSPQGGLLFEATGSEPSTVEQTVTQGLNDMMRTRSWDFSEISLRIAEAAYPVGCALVAAVFVIPHLQFLEWFWTSPSAD